MSYNVPVRFHRAFPNVPQGAFVKLFSAAILTLLLATTAGCGLFAGTAASVAVSKYQCEKDGGYWDEVNGCQPQDPQPTAEPTAEPTNEPNA